MRFDPLTSQGIAKAVEQGGTAATAIGLCLEGNGVTRRVRQRSIDALRGVPCHAHRLLSARVALERRRVLAVEAIMSGLKLRTTAQRFRRRTGDRTTPTGSG